MAMHARPVPRDPYNPLPPSNSRQTILHPSPYVPIRVPIFRPVIVLNDAILRVVNFGIRSRSGHHQRTLAGGKEWRDEQLEQGDGESVEMKTRREPILRQSGLSRRKLD